MIFSEKQKIAFVTFLLMTVIAVVYSGVVGNDFVNFDDNDYVTSNSVVQKGLSWEGVLWAFTSFHASNWHPLTWDSHLLDYQLYGSAPRGRHLTNVFFHVMNTVLIFWVLRFSEYMI